MGNATSLFNLMRNIGGSIGIAMVTTVLARKQQVHVNQLAENVTNFNASARQMLSAVQQGLMAQGSDAATAARQAQAAVWGMVQQHAAMMSYNDVFFLLAVLFAVMLPLIILMRRPKHQGGDIAVH
jgi:DHA2 family multidrug resistance protein